MFQAAPRSRICGSLRYHISGSNKLTWRKNPKDSKYFVSSKYLMFITTPPAPHTPPSFEAKSPIAFAGLKRTVYLRKFLNSTSKVWDSRCVPPHPTTVHIVPNSSFLDVMRWLVTEKMKAWLLKLVDFTFTFFYSPTGWCLWRSARYLLGITWHQGVSWKEGT